MPKRKGRSKSLTKSERTEVRQIAKKATLSLAETKSFFTNGFHRLWPVQARVGSPIAVRGFMLNRNDDFSQVPIDHPQISNRLNNSHWRVKCNQMLYGSIWEEPDTPATDLSVQAELAKQNVGFPCLPFEANRRFTDDMLLTGVSLEGNRALDPSEYDSTVDAPVNAAALRVRNTVMSNLVEGHECIPTRTTIEWCFQRSPLVIRGVDIIKKGEVDESRNYVAGNPPKHVTDVWGGANDKYQVHNILNNVDQTSTSITDAAASGTAFATSLTEAIASDGFDVAADTAVVVGAGVALVDSIGNLASNAFSALVPTPEQESYLDNNSSSANAKVDPNDPDPRAKAHIDDFSTMEEYFGLRTIPEGSEGSIKSGGLAPHLAYEKKLLRDADFDKYFSTHQFDYQYRFVRVKLKKTKFAGTYSDPRKDLFVDKYGEPTGIASHTFLPSHCRDYKLNSKLYTILDDKRFSLACPGALNATPADTFGGLNAKKNSGIKFTTSHKVAAKASYKNSTYSTYDTLAKNDQQGHGAMQYPTDEQPNEFIAVHCWIDEQNDFVYPLTFDEEREFELVGHAGNWKAELRNKSSGTPIVPGWLKSSTISGTGVFAEDAHLVNNDATISLMDDNGVHRPAYVQSSSTLSLPAEYSNDRSASTANTSEDAGLLVQSTRFLNRHPRDAAIQAPNDWTMNCRCVAKFKDF